MVYYSQTGATKSVAEEFQKLLKCDITAIEAVNPYDGDYDATIQRWRKELEDSVKVEIKPLSVNLDDYNTVFLGFPIWGGTYALPMATFLADNSLESKKVVTFATFGSGGIDSATTNISTVQPGAKVIKGYGVRNARIEKAPAEIERFLIENDYIVGEIEALPEYSSSSAVTEEEVKVFNEACGSYKFPLGTPVSVATRTTSDGKDYKFDVKSQSPDGKESSSTIYVTVPNGQAPEFTEVIRH
ncbi:MAG: hypothetical protein HDR88_07190 [Bacteroides sp.]|nr:hypothetical protein [Bacteroides sp.]